MTIDYTKLIYRVDMDGVVADFARGIQRIFPDFIEGQTERNKKMDGEMWRAISKYQRDGGKFWFDLEPMADAMELWNFVKPYNPEILTACGNASFGAGEQKVAWIKKHFGPDVKVHLCEKAIMKAQHAGPTVVLIDDKLKAIQPFRDAGGIGILHTSAKDTIEQLKRL